MPVLALLLIAAVSLVIVRVGATALKMTGLSSQVADFQAVSCFFGVGFTTSESEMIVSHPARRKIATYLIISGNIGLASALSALIVTFQDDRATWFEEVLLHSDHPAAFILKLVLILAMVLSIGLIFKVGPVRRVLEGVIRLLLNRSGAVRAIDYDTVLHAKDGYVVSLFDVYPDNAMVGRSLGEIGLGHRGVIVIGILHDSGEYVGTPHRDSIIQPGDVLTVYGVEHRLREVLRSESPEP